MAAYLISVSLLASVLLIISIVFREKASARVIYALWLLLVVRICIPFSLFEIEVPLHTESEQIEAETIETDVNSEQSGSPILTMPNEGTYTDEEMDPSPLKAPIRITVRKTVSIIWISVSALFFLWFTITKTFFTTNLWNTRIFYKTYKDKKVYISDHILSPCVAGFKPVIYITTEAADSEHLDLILEHESTHISHGDHLWDIIRCTVLTVFWWNPIVWAAAVLSKQDAELACDEAVTAKMEKKIRSEYAHMIFEAASQSRRYSIGFGTGHIKERMIMLTRKKNSFSTFAAVLLSVIAVCAAFTVPVAAKGELVSGGSIDIVLPSGGVLSGTNTTDPEQYGSFEEYMFSKTVLAVDDKGTVSDDGKYKKFDITVKNGDVTVKFLVTAPLDYQRERYPVVMLFPSIRTAMITHGFNAKNITDNDCICVTYIPRNIDAGESWDLAENDLSDISIMMELLLKSRFINKEKIFTAGASNGSVLALITARKYNENICGVAVTNPLVDWEMLYRESYQHQAFLSYYCGGSPDEFPEEYSKRSAVSFAGEIKCPVLIIDYPNSNTYESIQGQAKSLKNAMGAVGGDCEIVTISNEFLSSNKFLDNDGIRALWEFIDKLRG